MHAGQATKHLDPQGRGQRGAEAHKDVNVRHVKARGQGRDADHPAESVLIPEGVDEALSLALGRLARDNLGRLANGTQHADDHHGRVDSRGKHDSLAAPHGGLQHLGDQGWQQRLDLVGEGLFAVVPV